MAAKPPSLDTENVRKTELIADGAAVALRVLFGRNLRQARIRAGLSAADIQAQAGFDEITLTNIESGHLDLRLTMLARLADVVGEDIVSLLR